MSETRNLHERVDIFLEAIGLVDTDGSKLASIRGVQGKQVDLELYTSPKHAAELVEAKTGLKANVSHGEEGSYWDFHLEGYGTFYFERYHSGSTYMMINGE